MKKKREMELREIDGLSDFGKRAGTRQFMEEAIKETMRQHPEMNRDELWEYMKTKIDPMIKKGIKEWEEYDRLQKKRKRE
jgi:hypothetical protein